MVVQRLDNRSLTALSYALLATQRDHQPRAAGHADAEQAASTCKKHRRQTLPIATDAGSIGRSTSATVPTALNEITAEFVATSHHRTGEP